MLHNEGIKTCFCAYKKQIMFFTSAFMCFPDMFATFADISTPIEQIVSGLPLFFTNLRRQVSLTSVGISLYRSIASRYSSSDRRDRLSAARKINLNLPIRRKSHSSTAFALLLHLGDLQACRFTSTSTFDSLRVVVVTVVSINLFSTHREVLHTLKLR